MKICIVSQPWTSLDPKAPKGSVPIITVAVAKQLSSRHEVTVLANRHPAQFASLSRSAVKYRFLYSSETKANAIVSKLLGLRGKKFPVSATDSYFPKYYESVAKWIASNNPDIVHVHTFPQAAAAIRERAPQS